MQSTAPHTGFDVITDFLASSPTPEEMLAYHLPGDLQVRVDELVERNGEGLLTFDQQQELYDFMCADEMMALLKAKTKLRLQMRPSQRIGQQVPARIDHVSMLEPSGKPVVGIPVLGGLHHVHQRAA